MAKKMKVSETSFNQCEHALQDLVGKELDGMLYRKMHHGTIYRVEHEILRSIGQQAGFRLLFRIKENINVP